MQLRGYLLALALVAGWAVQAPSDEPAKKQPAIGEEVARVNLKPVPDALTGDMHRKSMLKYFPAMLPLSKEKPARITKEPKYDGAPLYGALTLGNGAKPLFDIVFDDSDDAAKIYFDANQDGDLTNDAAVKWEKIDKQKERTSLEGNFLFKVSWKTDKGETTGDYGLLMYRSKGLDKVFLRRQGARGGELKLDGKTYNVLLADNACDAVYDNEAAQKAKKVGVWLLVDLDGDGTFKPTQKGREVFDTTGPIRIGDGWYTATFPADGSSLVLKAAEAPQTAVEAPRNPLLKVGAKAPDFEMVLLDGKTSKLSDRKGKVVLVDFWATWCGPCMTAMPKVEALYQQLKDQGVEVIGLNVYDEKAAFEKWADGKKDKFSFTIGRDPAGKAKDGSTIAAKWGVYAIPTMYLLDKDGNVALMLQGYDADAEAALAAALKGLGVRLK